MFNSDFNRTPFNFFGRDIVGFMLTVAKKIYFRTMDELEIRIGVKIR